MRPDPSDSGDLPEAGAWNGPQPPTHVRHTLNGSRLSKLYHRDVDGDGILRALAPLFAAWARDRQPREHFGDYLVCAEVVARTITGLDFHHNLALGLSDA